MPFERDPNELGVLWEKSSKRGTFFAGTLEIDGVKQKIVVFKNAQKRSEKQPDWRILKSQPREEREPRDNNGGVADDTWDGPEF